MKIIGKYIADVIKDYNNQELQIETAKKIKELCARFPVYENL